MKLRRRLALGVLMLLIATVAPASAEEAKMNALQTALSSTTISGYVDTSVEWTLGDKDSMQCHAVGGWWRSFRIWLRTHRWR